ncbi:MAG: NUDIX domain-containing protein [bacterium]|nr:NUDIX domain-containing protein [bacterium]MDZ4284345.1 NUDIX domain-containing protein [Patescibacteria group bacterium]
MEKPKGASMFFINREDNILLFLRDKYPIVPKDKYPNMWDVLGGHVEDESPLECIRREMQEELGLYISMPLLLGVIEFPDRTDHVFCEFLWNDDVNRLNKKLTEGQRVCWFGLDEIRKMDLAYGWQPHVIAFLEHKKRVRSADFDPCSPEQALARDRAWGFR